MSSYLGALVGSPCAWALSRCGTAAMFGEELLEEPPHRLAVPVFWPDLDPGNAPPLVQQVARRNPPRLEPRAHDVIGIEEVWEREPVCLDEGCDDVFSLDINGNGQDLKAFFPVGLVEGLHGPHFDPAWGAPGSPEVDQNYLPTPIGET